MKKALTPRQAAQHYDFTTLDKIHVLNLSVLEFNAIFAVLEDCNQHSENTVFLALRSGSEADIEEAREILTSHRKTGNLSPDLSRRRHALLSKLSGIQIETEAEKNIPAAVATVVIPRALLEQLSIVCFISAPHYSPTMPAAGKAILEKLANQCFEILTT